MPLQTVLALCAHMLSVLKSRAAGLCAHRDAVFAAAARHLDSASRCFCVPRAALRQQLCVPTHFVLHVLYRLKSRDICAAHAV